MNRDKLAFLLEEYARFLRTDSEGLLSLPSDQFIEELRRLLSPGHALLDRLVLELQSTDSEPIRLDGFEIYPRERQIKRPDGQLAKPRPKDRFRVLLLLLANRGHVVSYERMIEVSGERHLDIIGKKRVRDRAHKYAEAIRADLTDELIVNVPNQGYMIPDR